MSRNGSGTYSLPAGNPVVSGTPISSSWANNTLSDIGNELTNSIDKAGRTTPTANLPLGGFVLTGLGAGSSAGQSVRFEQVQIIGEASLALSASTTDIFAASETNLLLTGGGFNVTGFPAGVLGQTKRVRFDNINTLVQSPAFELGAGGTNITTAAGDCAELAYVAAGVKVLNYYASTGIVAGMTFPDGTVAIPGIRFGLDPDNGFYRIGANSIGLSIAGANIGTFSGTLVNLQAPAGFNPLTLRGGAGSGLTQGGAASLSGGTSVNASAGPVQISGGSATGSGTGGSAGLSGGAAINSAAGDAAVIGGSASGSGDGGEVSLVGGGSVSGTAGNVKLFPGQGVTDGRIVFGLAASGVSIFRIDGNTGHQSVTDTAGVPTITSGAGAGATITGNDNGFKLVIGAGAVASITITFAQVWTEAPMAWGNYGLADIRPRCTTTTATVVIDFSAAPAAGGILHVRCLGRSAT